MRPRYVLHPGYVVSRNDHDRHYIGSGRLRELYGLRPDDNVIVDDGPDRYWTRVHGPDVVHLYPRFDGNYQRVHE